MRKIVGINVCRMNFQRDAFAAHIHRRSRENAREFKARVLATGRHTTCTVLNCLPSSSTILYKRIVTACVITYESGRQLLCLQKK